MEVIRFTVYDGWVFLRRCSHEMYHLFFRLLLTPVPREMRLDPFFNCPVSLGPKRNANHFNLRDSSTWVPAYTGFAFLGMNCVTLSAAEKGITNPIHTVPHTLGAVLPRLYARPELGVVLGVRSPSSYYKTVDHL